MRRPVKIRDTPEDLADLDDRQFEAASDAGRYGYEWSARERATWQQQRDKFLRIIMADDGPLMTAREAQRVRRSPDRD